MNRHQELAIMALQSAASVIEAKLYEVTPENEYFLSNFTKLHKKTIAEIDEAIEWIRNLTT